MRKGLVFWCAFILGFALIALALVFAGREPEGRHLASAIPQPKETSPYVYMEGEGKSFVFALEPLPKGEGKAADLLEKTSALSPLLEAASRAAFLFAWESNRFQLHGAFLFPREIVKKLSNGVLPQEWVEKEPKLVLEKHSEGILALSGPSPKFSPLFVSLNGGLTLLASSPSRLAEMVRVLETGKDSISPTWDVEKSWPNHLKIFDGGLLSQMASMQEIPVSLGNLTITAGWMDGNKGGRLRWKVQGLEGLLPADVRAKLQPVSWEGRFLIPDPWIAALGLNVPQGLALRLADSEMGKWTENLGMEREETDGILPGPVVASLCGNSKFLLFSLPGILLQLPGRGSRGETFINSFWNKDWSSLVPGVEKIDGFPAGGTTAIPFSILGAANGELVQLGLLERDHIKPENYRFLTEAVPALKEAKDALLWVFFHAGRLSDAMEGIGKAGALAEKFGKDIGKDLRNMIESASRLKGLGSVTMVLQSLDEGLLEWTREAPDGSKRGRQQ